MIPVCLVCHKEIPPPRYTFSSSSYYARKYHQECRIVMLHSQFLDRPQTREVVRLCEAGEETLEAIGEHFGITRERVRQIYKKATGKSKAYAKRSKTYREMREKEKQAKREAFLERVSFVCAVCHTLVKVRDRKRGFRQLCLSCAEIARKTNRNLQILLTCRECGKQFHPYRNAGTSIFHNRGCYFRFQRRRKELGIPFRTPPTNRVSPLFDSPNTS